MKGFGFSKFIYKILLVIILFLILAILCKGNNNYKNYIYNRIYDDNLNFSSFRNFYQKYLGGVLKIYDKDSSISVFNEKISYNYLEDYYDGVKITVSNNYLIPAIDNGIVVYIGDKENYGNVIILENDDGIDIWYGNVCNSTAFLYDNIADGDYIGEACGNYLYMVFSKENTFLDYDDYLS